MIPDSSTVPQAVHTESALKSNHCELKIHENPPEYNVSLKWAKLDLNEKEIYWKPTVLTNWTTFPFLRRNNCIQGCFTTINQCQLKPCCVWFNFSWATVLTFLCRHCLMCRLSLWKAADHKLKKLSWRSCWWSWCRTRCWRRSSTRSCWTGR